MLLYGAVAVIGALLMAIVKNIPLVLVLRRAAVIGCSASTPFCSRIVQHGKICYDRPESPIEICLNGNVLANRITGRASAHKV